MANTTDKSILTAAGKALLAQLNAEEKPLIIDKMIFANVPNRPEFPQPDDVVPTDDIVHQEVVEQRGRLSADSVIYSTTLTSNVGPFQFNWTGTYCSEYDVLVTIDHHALTPKTADEPGVAGNTLVRSVVLEYKDIAEITNITVDASSWQYNATDRMKKMDNDAAQSIIDQNGKNWFIEDGFLITPSSNAYNIKAGAGYVSGNRVSIEFDRSVQVPNKPSFVYIDAHREGTPTGEQVTLFDFVITAEEKDDYIDSSTGKDIPHFVCKIAEVHADDSVSDIRQVKSSFEFDSVDEVLRGAQKHFKPFTGMRVNTKRFNANINQAWTVVDKMNPDEFCLPIEGTEFFLQETSDTKYFESFGAYGNGSDLDDSAFDFAQSYAGKVLGRNKATYSVSQYFDLTNTAKWDGSWAKLKLTGNNYFATVSSGCKLENFDVDGLDEDHTAYPVSIATPSINAQIGDMIYRNFHGKTSTQTYPLKIPAYGAKNFSVGNQKFFNILQDDDGAVIGKGFVGGVYLVGVDSETSLGKSYGTVGDIYGDVIKSVDVGLGVVQDSDLVRMYAETPEIAEQFDITFGNIVGRNVYKRIVKGSSFPGVKFGDVWSFNPQEDSENYTLFAVVECLGTAKNLKFGDVYSEGPSERNVWMKGNGNKCGDIFDGAGASGVIFGGAGEQAVSCQVGNLLGRGLNDNSPQGTAVYFFNADKCQAGSVTGLFSSTVLTASENIGHNTLGDITCNGRMDISNGSTTVGAIDVDITATPVAGSHYILGKNAKLTQTEIITDGRVTMSVTGPSVDVDLGRTRIVRASSQNGDEVNHSIFTSASASNGVLRGKLEIEVNATIQGTPSGSSGRTLAYFSGLKVDDFDLSMNVTASARGATGFHYWFNGVDGQANRIAVKSAISLVGSQLNGKLGITKLENLVPGGSSVTCTGEVNVFNIEKHSDANVNGLNNQPMIANSTR
ncbi:phage tail protein [Vibrio parahaemolyticus]|uniref:phage tail protein n=1 Tax=Vibrio parahaemolyticus TaxID=670 RepID=UPI002152078C|nr:phage tail protein [Vibrio parahaemolyticus]